MYENETDSIPIYLHDTFRRMSNSIISNQFSHIKADVSTARQLFLMSERNNYLHNCDSNENVTRKHRKVVENFPTIPHQLLCENQMKSTNI